MNAPAAEVDKIEGEEIQPVAKAMPTKEQMEAAATQLNNLLRENPTLAVAMNVLAWSRQLYRIAWDVAMPILSAPAVDPLCKTVITLSAQHQGEGVFDPEKLFQNIAHHAMPLIQTYVMTRRQEQEKQAAEIVKKERLQLREMGMPVGWSDIPRGKLTLVLGEADALMHCLRFALQTASRPTRVLGAAQVVAHLDSRLRKGPTMTEDRTLASLPVGTWHGSAASRKKFKKFMNDLLPHYVCRRPDLLVVDEVAQFAGHSRWVPVHLLSVVLAIDSLARWADEAVASVLGGIVCDDADNLQELLGSLKKDNPLVVVITASVVSSETTQGFQQALCLADRDGNEIGRFNIHPLENGANYGDQDQTSSEDGEAGISGERGPGDRLRTDDGAKGGRAAPAGVSAGLATQGSEEDRRGPAEEA